MRYYTFKLVEQQHQCNRSKQKAYPTDVAANASRHVRQKVITHAMLSLKHFVCGWLAAFYSRHVAVITRVDEEELQSIWDHHGASPRFQSSVAVSPHLPAALLRTDEALGG